MLADVRDAVEDWPKMRDRADARRRARAARRRRASTGQEVSDAVELLRWLADGHFTFIGYREYTLDQGDERGRC